MKEHSKHCEVCDLARQFSDANLSTEALAKVFESHTTTRWIGGYTKASTNPIGTVLSYPNSQENGLAFFHYTWSFVWFICSLIQRNRHQQFFEEYACILVEEVANHVQKLLPFFSAVKQLVPAFNPVFSVVDGRDIQIINKSGFMAVAGAADAWINDDFWKKGPLTPSEKPYDVFLASTGAHNNDTDVKKVLALMNRYDQEKRTEKVLLLYYDGEDERIAQIVKANPNISWLNRPISSEKMKAHYQASKSFAFMSEFEGGSRYFAEASNCGCTILYNEKAQFHHAFNQMENMKARPANQTSFWGIVSEIAQGKCPTSLATHKSNDFFSASKTQAKILKLLKEEGLLISPPDRMVFLQPEISHEVYKPFPVKYAPCLPVIKGSYSARPDSLPTVDFERVLTVLGRTNH